jgi:dTDP-4-amino-4,6-dideoxygalactose transaminase
LVIPAAGASSHTRTSRRWAKAACSRLPTPHGRTSRRIRAIEPDADFHPRPHRRLHGYSAPDDDIERHAKNAYDEDCARLRHPGTNSTLSEPAAAVGRVQLQRLNEFLRRRRQIAKALDKGLSEIPGIRAQVEPPNVQSARHLYTCFLDPDTGIDRDELIRRLDQRGIQIQLRYFPLHLLPEWRQRGHDLGECPVAERIWFHEQINLPIYPQLEDWQVDFMIDTMARAMREFIA